MTGELKTFFRTLHVFYKSGSRALSTYRTARTQTRDRQGHTDKIHNIQIQTKLHSGTERLLGGRPPTTQEVGPQGALVGLLSRCRTYGLTKCCSSFFRQCEYTWNGAQQMRGTKGPSDIKSCPGYHQFVISLAFCTAQLFERFINILRPVQFSNSENKGARTHRCQFLTPQNTPT